VTGADGHLGQVLIEGLARTGASSGPSTAPRDARACETMAEAMSAIIHVGALPFLWT